MSFTGKVVLITGSSAGIGADAAIHLSKLGASVALVGRNVVNLKSVATQIRAAGAPEPLEIVADVTTDAQRIIDETISKFGRLDVLVNNAGRMEFSDEIFGTLEIFDSMINTNLRSVLALTKAAVPHLEKTKGNVVNVSSIAALKATRKATAYAISKAALDHFTRCAAVELAPKGIRVNTVSPGATETSLFENGGLDTELAEDLRDQCRKSYPFGRICSVEDISKAIAFLAGEQGSFVSGHILLVDGGKLLVK